MNENFEKMMNKLSPTLRRITHRLNGRFTFFNEDDLFQEGLAHLWIAFNKGNLSDKTDSYILQGCYYYLKNHIRTVLDKAVLVSLNELLESGDMSFEDILTDVSQDITGKIDEALLKESVRKDLSAREREVLELSLDGLTVREIGTKLNVSHVMVVKIRAKLKDKLIRFKEETGRLAQ